MVDLEKLILFLKELNDRIGDDAFASIGFSEASGLIQVDVVWITKDDHLDVARRFFDPVDLFSANAAPDFLDVVEQRFKDVRNLRRSSNYESN